MRFLFYVVLVLLSCKIQYATADRPIRVILDTDMGNDIDDALALDMLYKYAQEKRVELLGIVVNKEKQSSLEYIDIVNNWYGFSALPLGKVSGSVVRYSPKADYTEAVAKDRAYRRTYKDYAALPEGVDLYRRLLAQERDHSVVIISVGFLTHLSRLLASPPDSCSGLSGLELVRKKVKALYLMGGSFDSEKPVREFNIRLDCIAAQQLFVDWPTPIVVSPVELGERILFPGNVMADRVNARHPLAVAYKAFQRMPYDRPTWDLTTVLAAVETKKGYFKETVPGHVVVSREAYTHFVPCPRGKHRILKLDPTQAVLVRQRFIELILRP